MKWIPQDIDLYEQAKEYVDTAVLPLFPVSFDTKMKETAGMSEFINLLTIQLERQLKGRLLLLPGFIYIKNKNWEKYIHEIHNWEQELQAKGFKHLFLVTSDSDWKAVENQVSSKLIWLPSLPFEDMEDKYKNSLLEDQVKR